MGTYLPLLVDPVIIVLLAVFIGIPVLSLVVMGLFGLSARFSFVEVNVRGGRLRGAIAAALARVIVRDTATIQLPLVVVLQKQGVLGRSTPLFGGATVRDVELKVFLDDEHVSTVTESQSTKIRSSQKVVELPLNVDVHLPRGVIHAYRDYREKKRNSAEAKLMVKGHVIVRHWFISRQVPINITRRVVIGGAVPRLVSVRWRPLSGDSDVWDEAELKLRLVNPYHDEVLDDRLRLELRRRRRMLPDAVLTVHEERGMTIRPGKERLLRYRVSLATAQTLLEGGTRPGSGTPRSGIPGGGRGALDVAAGEAEGVPEERSPEAVLPMDEAGEDRGALAVSLRAYWGDQELDPEEVRVLGVPGARHGPHLSLGVDGTKERKRSVVARIESVTATGKVDS